MEYGTDQIFGVMEYRSGGVMDRIRRPEQILCGGPSLHRARPALCPRSPLGQRPGFSPNCRPILITPVFPNIIFDGRDGKDLKAFMEVI